MEERKQSKIGAEHLDVPKKKVGGALGMRVPEIVPFKMHGPMCKQLFLLLFFFKGVQSQRMKPGTFPISGKTLTLSKVEKKKAPAKRTKAAANVCE